MWFSQATFTHKDHSHQQSDLIFKFHCDVVQEVGQYKGSFVLEGICQIHEILILLCTAFANLLLLLLLLLSVWM